MSSALVNKGILFLFSKFSDVITNGKPLAVMLGFLLGLAAGASVMIESIYAGIFTAVLGGFAGALIGAILCPREKVLLASYGDGTEGFGEIVDTITVDLGGGGHTTVVMEHAIYAVSRSQLEGTALPESAYRKLEEGIHPQLDGGNLIVLTNILHLEAPTKTSMGLHLLNIYYVSKRRQRCKQLEFGSREARADYVSYLEQHMGASFASETVPMELRRALIGPMIMLIVVCLVTFGLTLLSSHWRNDPAPPPVGKTEQDSLVRAVIQVGPFGFLLAGTAVALAALFWMYRRMKSPPLVTVFRPIYPSAKPVEDAVEDG